MKRSYNKKNKSVFAFTLVELVVTIAVLAILSLIWFLSFWNYTKDARDSVKISDLKNIQKVFELNLVKWKSLPLPDNITSEEVVLDEIPWVLWEEWVFWENSFKETQDLSDLPLNPINEDKYRYLVTKDRENYYMEVELENWEIFKITNYHDNFDLNKFKKINSDNNTSESCQDPIYIHENWITVKARDCTEPWLEYDFNWERWYVAWSTYDLKQKILEGYPVNRLVTTKIKNMKRLFYNNKNFNWDIRNWDTSNVKNMWEIFSYAESFNQNIGIWNTSKVENMDLMFHKAKSFNQPIWSWNTSNVKSMKFMFYAAENFNQPIWNWDIWNVSDMSSMFAFATKFNQNISNWNISNVKEKNWMFYNAISYSQW